MARIIIEPYVVQPFFESRPASGQDACGAAASIHGTGAAAGATYCNVTFSRYKHCIAAMPTWISARRDFPAVCRKTIIRLDRLRVHESYRPIEIRISGFRRQGSTLCEALFEARMSSRLRALVADRAALSIKNSMKLILGIHCGRIQSPATTLARVPRSWHCGGAITGWREQ
jgi:hypothetical protein